MKDLISDDSMNLAAQTFAARSAGAEFRWFLIAVLCWFGLLICAAMMIG
jgi:hypothetical protein